MKRKGFTLIEILVVVAIIGVLSAAIIVGLSEAQKRGRDTARVRDLRNVQTGLELYYTKEGAYPAATDWDTLESVLKEASIGVTKLPRDPSKKDYEYATNGDIYVLKTKLETDNPALNNSLTTQETQDLGVTIACDPGSREYCITLE